MPEHDPVPFKSLDEVEHLVGGVHIRRHFGDLRADMAVDTDDLDILQGSSAPIQRQRLVQSDAKFVLLEPGGDVRMSLRIDIGIGADRDARPLAHRARHLLEPLEFFRRFEVEAQDVGSERGAHFIRAFAHPGEDDLAGVTARGEYARQFATGDDVETGSGARQQVQNGKIGIGLHRIADERRPTSERVRVGQIRVDDRTA